MIRLARHLVGMMIPLVVFATHTAAADRVRFNEQIRPLLSDRCFACHGPDGKRREADLRLDVREHAIGAGDGPQGITPGKPDASPIWERITSTDPDLQMPPPSAKKPQFTDAERELIRRWIEEGAEYEGHWAFLPLKTAIPPREMSSTHPIDAFIRSRLVAAGIKPSPPADRATLLRRITLDLTGLLPSPEDVTTFENDAREEAYVRVVDRLLASPQYGERWGRHWLDQARYADSNGYAIDAPRDMWPYRDWVIDAVNRDLPFDQFTVEQLAGDLLPDPTKSQLIATGFHRNTLINQEGGTDREQFRVEATMDRVATTGAVWLGLTVGCAQCHTHKFDPITQREYYQLFAFFNSAQDANDRGPTVDVRRGEVFGNPVHIPEPPKPPTKEELAKLRADWEQTTLAWLIMTSDPLPADQQSLMTLLQKPSGERSKKEADELQARFLKDVPRAAPVKKEPNPSLVQTMVMRDLPQPRETFLFTRGDFTRPDKDAGTLSPGVLSAVTPVLSATDAPRTRLDLARWLIHPDNPLTPRVTVNRVWMRYFGRGLVETEEDFGTQGTPPVHPELLDWLSREFQRQNWSLKALHRLIVTSETYRQSSHERTDAAERDPRNLLLGRQQRLRLEAEVVRDAALSASGLLDVTLGGPSVFPPQPDGVYAFTQVNKSWPTETGPQRFRRTMYTFFYRSAPYPLFATFDVPDFQAVCTRRLRSNTPLQALTLANDVVFLELAQGLAARLASECPGSFEEQLEARMTRGVRLCFGRAPTPVEARVLRNYVTDQVRDLENDTIAAERLTTSTLRQSLPAREAAGLVLLARTLLNADNFITRE